MSFDLKKFLTENKLTRTSKFLKESQKVLILEHEEQLITSVVHLLDKYEYGDIRTGIWINDVEGLLYDVIEAIKTVGRGDEIRFEIVTKKMVDTVDKLIKKVDPFRSSEMRILASRILDVIVDPYNDKEFEDRLGRKAQASVKSNNTVSENTDVFSEEEVIELAHIAEKWVLDAKDELLDAVVAYGGRGRGVPRNVVDRILDNYDLSLDDLLSTLADDKEYDQEQERWRDSPYSYIDQKFPDKYFDDLVEGKKNLKQNNMSFDIRKFLTENKLTKSSRLAENDLAFEAEEMQAPVAEEPTVEVADVSRYLNLESADDVIREIESEVSRNALETKINKIKEAIEALDSKASSLEEDSNLQGFVNPARLKEMRRMSKKLKVMQERYSKVYEKKYNKKKNKEVTNEDAERAFGGTKTVHTAGSILEPVLQQINSARDYLSAKTIVLDAINGSGLAQEMKDKMIADVEGTKTFDRLLKYVYNAYLAKAGLRSPDSGSRMKEDISEEEEVQVRTVSRADAGKFIRGATKKKPMVGADYQGMKDSQIKTVSRRVKDRSMKNFSQGNTAPAYRDKSIK